MRFRTRGQTFRQYTNGLDNVVRLVIRPLNTHDRCRRVPYIRFWYDNNPLNSTTKQNQTNTKWNGISFINWLMFMVLELMTHIKFYKFYFIQHTWRLAFDVRSNSIHWCSVCPLLDICVCVSAAQNVVRILFQLHASVTFTLNVPENGIVYTTLYGCVWWHNKTRNTSGSGKLLWTQATTETCTVVRGSRHMLPTFIHTDTLYTTRIKSEMILVCTHHQWNEVLQLYV